MSLDVVVVTHNSARHLASALEGLPPDARVIVVDNASNDGSADLAADLGAEVLPNPVNAGFGAAANVGAALGDGDHVLFLNPDAVVTPELVRGLVARLAADPGLAVVSPRLQYLDGGEQRVAWPFPSAAGAWREALGLHRLVDRSSEPGFVIGACFLVRREAFDAAGGFDERIWLYGEEAELCRRLVEGGWRIGLVGGLVAGHVGGASSIGLEDLVFEHFQRGGEHIVAIHDGPGALVSYRLANLAGALLRSWLPGRGALHRRRAGRLARLLLTEPTTVALDSPATAAPGALVVCSLEAWDDVWRRNQFLVRELLRLDTNRRVLFVEPAFDVVHEQRRAGGRVPRRGLRPVEGDGRIVRFEPVKVVPRVLGPFADRSLRRQVRRAARRLGFVHPVLWVNDSTHAGLATATGWPATYDITDDWTRSGDGPRSTRRVVEREGRLFGECASVVVCSEDLAASRRSARPDLLVIPNAVDAEHLRRPRPRPADLPPGPVAVYVGTLHEDRLDVDLVAELARSRPQLEVVLVGPIALGRAGLDALEGLANVSLLGARPYSEVPGYLQHADVVVVPHVVTPFTESLDPIKAYECLAVGRPTVSTPVAGFRDLGSPVECVDRSTFVARVLELVDGPRRPDEPRDVPSWSERARAMEQALLPEGARVPLKVVYVDHCAELSGGELALVRLLPALIERGVDAHVVLGGHGPLEARLVEAGATVEVLPLDAAVAGTRRGEVRLGGLDARRVVALARDIIVLRRRLVDLRPDLVHTNSLKAALYGGVAARSAGIPVVWHIRDRIASDYLPLPAVVLVRALARLLPTVVIANSAATRATLGPFLRAAVIPSPVVHDPVPHDEVPGVPRPTRFRVGMVGRLAPWKGQHVFLAAFADAFRGRDAVAVLAGSAMFGEDAYETELRAQVARLGIQGQVEFLGFVDDVAGLLAGLDCLVHASVIPEPFGQVVLEGLAAGLPVIASAEGGPREVITDGVDGLLCPPGDVSSLAGLLRKLESDPDARERLGAAGRRRSLDFSPAMIGEQVMDDYRFALTRR